MTAQESSVAEIMSETLERSTELLPEVESTDGLPSFEVESTDELPSFEVESVEELPTFEVDTFDEVSETVAVSTPSANQQDCFENINTTVNNSSNNTTPCESCIDKDIFYVSVGIGSLFCVLFFILLILILVYYRKYIRYNDPKKVSRAESWRYESNIYINPGRQKPAVPVYVAPPVLPPVANRKEKVDVIQEVDTPRYDTLDRWSAEGSTRAASPQTSPLLNSRHGSNAATYSPSTINSRPGGQHSRSGSPGLTPQATPPSSPPGRRSGASRGHNRNSSLSSALRGVDIIRCGTPGYPPPPPSPPPAVMAASHWQRQPSQESTD